MIEEKRPGIAPAVVCFDGLCEPTNPGGWGCWGWSALDGQGAEVACGWGFAGRMAAMTNNVAEYQGLIYALSWLEQRGFRGVTVRGDSELVVKQVRGEYAAKAHHLIDLRDGARALLQSTKARLEWVPRAENARADALSRKAYAEAQKRHPQDVGPSWVHQREAMDPRPELAEDSRLWTYLLRLAWHDDQCREPDGALLMAEALHALRLHGGARLVAAEKGYRIRPGDEVSAEEFAALRAQYPALTAERVRRLLAGLPKGRQ